MISRVIGGTEENPVQKHFHLLVTLLAISIMVLASPPASAQSRYPERPVTLVVPSPPGGVHDVIGRVWAEKLRPHLGTIVVENRGGAGAMIGATDVARAKADGYTLLLGSTTTQVLITPLLAKPPFEPFRDFITIAAFAASSTSVAVAPTLPVHSLKELIDYVKANPGKLSYGSTGNGSITHLTGELFKKLAGGLDIVHVPYKGIGPALNDLVSGHIPMLTPNATGQIPQLNETGKLRLLSVNSAQRLDVLPNVPTSTEAGLEGMIAQTTFAIFAPAGTPKEIIEKISGLTQTVMAEREFQSQLIKIGFEPLVGLGPDKSDQLFREEAVRWVPIIKSIGTAN
jgi:tripartite-type tricarboxylate transporter receptor subunit TctC